MIHCGYCDSVFKEYKQLEYIAEQGHYANCCPNCGICDYENGADFKVNIIA